MTKHTVHKEDVSFGFVIDLLALLLFMIFITTSFVSGTYAKYTASDTSYDTSRVASWNPRTLGSPETVIKTVSGEGNENGAFEFSVGNNCEVANAYALVFDRVPVSVQIELTKNSTSSYKESDTNVLSHISDDGKFKTLVFNDMGEFDVKDPHLDQYQADFVVNDVAAEETDAAIRISVEFYQTD